MKIHSKVFKTAHQIKTYFNTWREAVKAAWIVTKLFFGYDISFVFNKIDKKTGEVTPRAASPIGVGSFDTVTKGFVRFVEVAANGSEQWRSFRIENLVV